MKNYQLPVTDEVADVGIELEKILTVLGDCFADGTFNPATEIPQVIVSSLQGLPAALAGIDKIDDEFQANPVQAAMALLGPISVGVANLLAGIRKGKNLINK